MITVNEGYKFLRITNSSLEIASTIVEELSSLTGRSSAMVSPTRGSRALDKAQRRLAQLKSVDENLDLGYGLTVESYNHLIETTRSALDNYNTLRSELKAARETVIQMDATLSTMSERMLSGVATKYGKRSIEYIKAGGSPRNHRQPASSTGVSTTDISTPDLSLADLSPIPLTNGSKSQ